MDQAHCMKTRQQIQYKQPAVVCQKSQTIKKTTSGKMKHHNQESAWSQLDAQKIIQEIMKKVNGRLKSSSGLKTSVVVVFYLF